MKLNVILDMSLQSGVPIKTGFAARCPCYCPAIGPGLLPLPCQALDSEPVIPGDSIIPSSCKYLTIRAAASSMKVVG